MGDINLRTKINNLDERVSKVEESGGISITDGIFNPVSTFVVSKKYVKKTGNLVQVFINGYVNEDIAAWGNLGTITPPPIIEVRNNYYGKYVITENGTIQTVDPLAKNASFTISATYITNG